MPSWTALTPDRSFCSANHPDGQIFTPPYLLNPNGSDAARPVINYAPSTTGPSSSLAVTTDSNITMFSLIRRGCVMSRLAPWSGAVDGERCRYWGL